MYVEMNLFGASILLLIFAILALLSHSNRTPAASRRHLFSKRSDKKERRAYPRYKASLRVKYKTPLEEGVSWIKDISKGGARLFLTNTLKSLGIGEVLEIEVSLPTEPQPIMVKGNIVWFKDNDAGLCFAETIKEDIDKIMEFVRSREGDAA